ncbi:unnamed protein product [Paramecium sonneborni]|uniref:Transmembrane protein n=1 Tax=Paramecium sonneborni TaxID=65129 RepID=A0A8S1RUQ3_9CILI|nr:unnamed protein product [Paramecium sonneborni]
MELLIFYLNNVLLVSNQIQIKKVEFLQLILIVLYLMLMVIVNYVQMVLSLMLLQIQEHVQQLYVVQRFQIVLIVLPTKNPMQMLFRMKVAILLDYKKNNYNVSNVIKDIILIFSWKMYSYNLTQINSGYQVYSQSSKSFFLNEDLNDPLCTLCYNGYDLYDNKCKGCGDGCHIDSVSMCVYEFDTADCSQCPPGQRSLADDYSDCADCPQYCEACRERTQDVINSINQLLNPSNSDFQRYSNLCYKIMKNFDSTKNLYLDTITHTPTVCSYLETSKKCYHTSTITFELNCNNEESIPDVQDLSSIFKHLLLLSSQKILKNMKTIYIEQKCFNIHGSEYKFQKPTQFKTLLQQNVFQLLKLNIHFKSSSTATFYQVGHLSFSNINNLRFENIQFQYNTEIQSKIKNFGNRQIKFIYINQFKNFQERLLKLRYVLFQFFRSSSLYLEQVQFIQLQPIDLFLDQNFTQESSYKLALTKIQFMECQFLIQIQILIKIHLIILQLLLMIQLQIRIHKYFFFGSQNGQTYAKITLSINDLKIQLSSFINSNLFLSNYIIASSISNVDIYTYQFINSVVFMLNHLNIQNFYVGFNKIFNNSIIFSTAALVDPLIVPISALQEFKITNVGFDQNDCNSINCLFLQQTPQNIYDIKNNLKKIVSLQITRTSSVIYTEIIRYFDSSLCAFKQFQNIQISKLKSVDNLGAIVFYFDQIKSIDIDTLQCDSIQSNCITVHDEFGEEITVDNSYNNFIPSSEYCAEQLWTSNNYNFYCLYVNEFSNGMKLNNIIISNQLLVDFNAIVIQSYDILRMKTSRAKDNLTQFYSNYDKEIIIISNIYAFKYFTCL